MRSLTVELLPRALRFFQEANPGGEGEFANREAYPFPELVMLDLKMPRLDGLEVLRWLKDHPEYRRMPKILLSGSAEDRE